MALLDFEKWVNNRKAELVSWVNTATELTSTEVQAVLEELANRTFKTYFKFREVSSEGASNTTSNVWVDKINITLNNPSDSITAGKYLCFAFCEITNTINGNQIGMRAKVNGTTFINAKNGVSIDNKYETRGGFSVLTLTAGAPTFLMQFGQTDDGGTGKIRRARMFIFRISA